MNSCLLSHNDNRVTQLWLSCKFKVSRDGTVSPIFELHKLVKGHEATYCWWLSDFIKRKKCDITYRESLS